MLPRLLLCGRNFVSACLIRLDVRFWHKADIPDLSASLIGRLGQALSD